MRTIAIYFFTVVSLVGIPVVGESSEKLKPGTPMTALESPEGAIGCEAWAINERDEVVGYCDMEDTALPVYWAVGTVIVLDGPVIVDTEDSIIEHQLLFGIAVGINDAGTIAGDLITTFGDRFAATWDDDAVAWQAFPPPPGWTATSARGINAKGDVVGTVRNDFGGFDMNTAIWKGGETVILPLVEDSFWCQGFAINNAGDVTGRCWTIDGEEHAGFWDKSGEAGYLIGGPDIPGSVSYGRAVNESGTVVGVDGESAMVWRKGNGTILADVGTANGINDYGDAVGFIGTNGGDPIATLWPARSTDGIELGTLGGAFSFARAINNRGVVAGLSDDDEGTVHAFIARPQ